MQNSDQIRTGAPRRARASSRSRSARARPSFGWRLGRFVFSILAPIMLLGMLAAGLGYFRLSQGPVSLKFLVKPFERGINSELDGLRAKIEDVVVSWSNRGGLEFRLHNVRLAEPGGAAIMSAPWTAVELSMLALLRLQAAPSRVELIEPSLLVHYSDDGGLSLRISTAQKATAKEPNNPSATSISSQAQPGPTGTTGEGQRDVLAIRNFDVSQIFEQALLRARQGLDAAGILSQLGLRDATVEFRYGARTSVFNVPMLEINRLSSEPGALAISGGIGVATGQGLATASFTLREVAGADGISLTTSIRNVVPSAMALTLPLPLPQLSLLRTLDLPIDGDASFQLSQKGTPIDGELALLLRGGRFQIPALSPVPVVLDSGRLNFVYDAERRLLSMAPSTLRQGNSRITLAGAVAGQDTAQGQIWRYDIAAKEGLLAAEEFGLPGIGVDKFEAKGRIVPAAGLVELEDLQIEAAGGRISMSGEIDSRVRDGGTRLDVELGAMSVKTALAMWPRAVAPGARSWVGERVTASDMKGGKVRFLTGRYYDEQAPGARASHYRLSVAIESENVSANFMDGMPPMVAPRVLTRLENEKLEIAIPDASLEMDGGLKVALKSGQFTSPDVFEPVPDGEISFAIKSQLKPVLALLKQPGLEALDENSLPFGAMSGKVKGDIKVSLPLLQNVRRADARIMGKMQITDGVVRKLFGDRDATGGDVVVGISDKSVDIGGKLLVGGVLSKLRWQKIFDAPEQLQPPMRLTARLDNADRAQLGLDVNHFVQGEMPVELTVSPGQPGALIVHLRADLTNAELRLEGAAWRKPPGHSAFLEADVVTANGETEIRNFNLSGDKIRVKGRGVAGKDGRMREFHFPVVSLNGIGEIDVRGRVGAKDIWKVRAKGTAFDGRDFFRSLFSVGQLAGRQLKPANPRGGVDLEATIDTVLGFEQLSLRRLKFSASKRGGKLTALKGAGTLQGGAPLAFELRKPKAKKRLLLADSTDAGEAFKLIGFYPNVRGGRVRLEVNLDGRGPAEKTGILWVENFDVLGDSIVTEVISSGGDGKPGDDAQRQRIKKKVTRQVFPFDRMKVPFSVGHGQFVLADSYVRGPVLGASVRGKVDFRNSRVNLGGTYIPLQGLNNMLGGLPLIGAIVSGPRGEGIFGMTYAVQGSMENPKVLVNPLSFVAPGIFREIFQMTPSDPRVQPPRREGRTREIRNRVRASSNPAARSRARDGGVDGWSSQN